MDRRVKENPRACLMDRGSIPSTLFNQDIRASWERCFENGLDPYGEPVLARVTETELHSLRNENHLVRRLADIEMKNLQRQIAGSEFVIIFANSDGIILDCVVDSSLEGSTGDRIRPGFIWREENNGTNALGLVAKTQKPGIVHGQEHYFKAYSTLTCAAAPIFGYKGKTVGIIDATSNCRSRQKHTLALVRMSCVTIENGLFRDRNQENLILELHSRPEFLGTLQSAMLSFDEDGFLHESSRQALLFLQGIPLHQDIHFSQVFLTPFEVFLDQARNSSSVQIADREGSFFAARAFNNFRRQRSVGAVSGSPLLNSGGETSMVHEDPQVKKAMYMVKRAVELNVPIFIRGETGTGKELMARYAHRISGRKGNFMALNCAALPEALIESELFGHRDGAFTGARKGGARGLVQQAHLGTLFLDEIGTMPLQIQAKLLRFLDRMEIRPVGKTKEIKLDIQIISATNADFEAADSGDELRADLLYRINTMEVNLPPLRKREDLKEIISAIISSFGPSLRLEPEAVEALAAYPWPGNIRELKGLLTRLYISCENGLVTGADVRAALPRPLPEATAFMATRNLADQERDIILESYSRNQGNISAVARELGVSRNKVYKELKLARKDETKQSPEVII